jgi:MscS family membrane protein
MLPVQANSVLANGFEIAVSVSVVWLLYKLANVASLFLEAITSQTDSKLDDQLVPLLRKSLKVFVVAVGVLFILQNNGINVTSLLAGLGIGGLAVALAARDTLANFFGSVTIFVDKPFQIGDWVKVGSLEGTVEEVGFRSTRIRTFYNSVITVPNSKLADSEIDNLGLREYRRFKTSINLTYDTTPEQMEAFVEGVKAIVRSTPAIRQDYYEIHFESLGAHSLDVLVYIFFKVPSWSDELQNRHNFLLDVMRLAREIGVEFAFPTQTLHISSVRQGEHAPAPAKAEAELAGVVESFAPEGTQVRPGGVRIFRDGKEIDYSALKG